MRVTDDTMAAVTAASALESTTRFTSPYSSAVDADRPSSLSSHALARLSLMVKAARTKLLSGNTLNGEKNIASSAATVRSEHSTSIEPAPQHCPTTSVMITFLAKHMA